MNTFLGHTILRLLVEFDLCAKLIVRFVPAVNRCLPVQNGCDQSRNVLRVTFTQAPKTGAEKPHYLIYLSLLNRKKLCFRLSVAPSETPHIMCTTSRYQNSFFPDTKFPGNKFGSIKHEMNIWINGTLLFCNDYFVMFQEESSKII